MDDLTVVKVGGSLYDWPDLGPWLLDYLGGLRTRRVLLVPGGGRAADVVRELDRRHGLGEEAAHWLALRALTVTAHFLARLLPGAVVVENVSDAGPLAVLDPFAFALADDGRPGSLPHTWDVTSDSIAARVAGAAGAGRLVLLKSVAVPAAPDWDEAARRGWVDPEFPRAVAAVRCAVEVICPRR